MNNIVALIQAPTPHRRALLHSNSFGFTSLVFAFKNKAIFYPTGPINLKLMKVLSENSVRIKFHWLMASFFGYEFYY